MAVVFIIGLTTTIVLPQFASLRGNELRGEARLLAGRLELARQRAILTGRPHRLIIDMDQHGYWVEQGLPEEQSRRALEAAQRVQVANPRRFDLSPPTSGRTVFEPLAGFSGKPSWLPEAFLFEGVESVEGWIEGGTFGLLFDVDGMTDPTEIVMGDGETVGLVLVVHPLLDNIRIRDVE